MLKECLKVKKEDTQKKIVELKEKNNIDSNYIIKKGNRYCYIPIKDKQKLTTKQKQVTIKKEVKKQKKQNKNFKEILEKKIPKNILDKINQSYDIVGDIVILGIKDGCEKYYENIGKAIKQVHPQIKSILNKKEHHGVFRTQFLDFVYGEDRRETIVKENNVRIKTDVENVFCSTRLSSERKRISKLVKKNEDVCVFFAGAGPFCLCVGKNTFAKSVYGFELNPIAINYFKENIKLNKLENKVFCVFGDVSLIYKNYKEKFDRIVMPHPTCSEEFIKEALYCLKDKGTIHFYKFVSKEKPFEEAEKILKKYSNIKIENKKIVCSYSPSVVEVVYDLKIRK